MTKQKKPRDAVNGETSPTRSGKPSTRHAIAPKEPKAKVGAPRRETASRRREQQRAIETRGLILREALSEFAERGFAAASIRNIGARTALQHPLITYHFPTKEILWKAVAENAFAEIRKLWDEDAAQNATCAPMDRLRKEYAAFLRFTIQHPHFHHFMLRESQPGNPRLPWLVGTILLPTLERLLPDIRRAQELGDLPLVDPALIHYMLIGMTSVLSSLKDEMMLSVGIKSDDPNVIEAYLSLIDSTVFRRTSQGNASQGKVPISNKNVTTRARRPKAASV